MYKRQGLDDDIAYAIEDHYKPRFSGDELPRNQVGICIALADKLETLAGMFFIGEKPTGDKDPYALRRHALGIIRILIESKLNIRLEQLWSEVNSIYSGAFPQLNFDHIKTKQEVTNFILDRLTGYLKAVSYTHLDVYKRQRDTQIMEYNANYSNSLPQQLHEHSLPSGKE